jgi:hypothetical protein
MVNWKGFGRKISWSNQDIIPAFSWTDENHVKPQSGYVVNKTSRRYACACILLLSHVTIT